MDKISGLIVFFFAVVILWQGNRLSVGSFRAPGPGFFPGLIAAALVVLSLVMILRGGKRVNEGNFFSARSINRVVVVFIALVAYFFLLEYLGFVIVSFLLMAFLFSWVARQKWYVALLSAIICTGLAYVLFEVFLRCNFPRGTFGL